jgi:uncharacterized damage-inducible protein DinB
MLPTTTIREFYFGQLRKGVQIVHSVFQHVPPQHVTTYRDNGTGWTALEVLCHMRDYESIFFERLSLTVEEDLPPLPNPNPDELAAERRYNEQDLATVYDEWTAQRTKLLDYLENLDEAAWGRQGDHPRRGRMTAQDQLTLIAWHDVNHIEQMTRILAEKKRG